MEQIDENILSSELDALSRTEFMVYQVVINGTAKMNDVSKIAKLCNLSDVHVIVAIQLLIYKGVLPAGMHR